MTDLSLPAPGPAPASSSSSSSATELAPPPERPAPTFDVLPLSREVRETLAEMGYLHPTPVQLAVWEPATRGRDAVVQARTGTGKTAAFGLPIVDHIVRRSMPQVQVLVLTPTRELALQVAAEVERLGKRKSVKIVAIYGGAPMQRQIDQVADGAQVVVGTPGRVLDHLRRGTLNPKHVRLLVLDESDEMLSMGFEREVSAILETLPTERQTLLFSATVPPDIDRMARNKLRSPEYITLSGDHIGALEIQHFVFMVTGDKVSALVRVLEVENPESALIFCNTKDETERVAGALSRQGYDADWLNGDLAQNDREIVMAKTREGRLRFLVATDVAARGIDLSHLTHVINHDFPQDAETYVHRTGRTGRAGRTGTAVSLITPRDVGGLYLLRLTYKIRPVEKQIPSEGDLKTRAEADLVAMLAEAFLSRPIHPDDLALARRLLSHDKADLIMAGLLRDHLGARPTANEEAAAARRSTSQPRARVEAVQAPPARSDARRTALPTPPARAPQLATPAMKAPEAERPAAISPVVPPRAPEQPAPLAQALRLPLAPAAEPAPPAPRASASLSAATPVATPHGPTPEGRARPEASEGRSGDERDGRRGDRRPAQPRRDGPRGSSRGPLEQAPTAPVRPRENLDELAATPLDRSGPLERGSRRHADFVSWQPPQEANDDEPIFAGERASDAAPAHAQAAPNPSLERRFDAPRPAAPPGEGLDAPDADSVEIFVNVGRREGVRAADFQRVLIERAGLDRNCVQRIRVRERNAFVSVRREDLAKAIAALSGATLAGRLVAAEQARGRSASDEAPTAAESGAAPQSIPAEPGASPSDPGAPVAAERA